MGYEKINMFNGRFRDGIRCLCRTGNEPDFDARSASWSVLSQWGGPHFYTDGADTIASVGGGMWNTFVAFNKIHTNDR
jgi:hypothetical protein